MANFIKPWAIFWIAFFVWIQMSFQHGGGVNPHSRLALLFAMIEESSFRIDTYADLTFDWAKTPDGHYFTNKAPGPVFAAFPFMWVLDRVLTARWETRAERDAFRKAHAHTYLSVASLVIQILPFAGLLLFATGWLSAQGTSVCAQVLFLIAAAIGNTASLYMNTFFGHGFAAVLFLAMWWAYAENRMAWAGFFLGWLILSDYGMALVVLPALYLVLRPTERAPRLARWMAGGVLPGALWVWYHSSCFGSPFVIANKFQNPLFVDVPAQGAQLWGVLRLGVNFSVLGQLLGGLRRGLLVTQPWVLVWGLGTLLCWRHVKSRFTPTIFLALSSLGLLLLMNSAFGGWHGGGAAGPRYLSAVFPLCAVGAGLLYDGSPVPIRSLLWCTVLVAALMGIVILSTTVTPPEKGALWGFYSHELFAEHNRKAWTRLALALPVFLILLGVSYKKMRDAR